MVQKIGIDFGTTNSLISVVTQQNKIKSFTEKDRPHPSVVHYEGERVICGIKAKNKLEQNTIGIHGSAVRGPKKFLDKDAISVGGIIKNPKEVVSNLMSFLIEHAKEEDEDGIADLKHAVVTIPVAMDGRGRQALREAFLDSGILIESFVHEPLAALYGYYKDLEDTQNAILKDEGKLILVFDWGGGTLDLTLCQIKNGSIIQILNKGNNKIGGDYLDEAILKYVEEQHAEKFKWTEDNQKSRNSSMRAKLLEECERAKITLSKRSEAPIFIPDYYNADGEEAEIDCWLSRDDLDKISKPLIDAGLREIDSILSPEQADIDRQCVALCLATGGMVNMPAIKQGLREIFGVSALHVSEKGDRIISEGAAWIAKDDAALTLAKPIELVEARNSLLTLIPEGTLLPKRGNTQSTQQALYCADPRDGKAVLSFKRAQMVGKTAAADRRTTIGNLVVPVNKDFPPLKERIDVDVKIDENLIMTVNAKSLDEGIPQELSVYDIEFSINVVGGSTQKKKTTRITKSVGEKLGVVIRSNVTHRSDAWHLVPGELLKEFNDNNPYLKQNLTQEQWDEVNYYNPCSNCGARWQVGCCNSLSPNGAA